MATLKSYSPDRFKTVFGGHTLQGFADGTMIELSELGDGFTSQAGADGEVLQIKSTDPRRRVAATLMQSSISNDVLSGMYQALRVGNGGTFPVLVADLSGTTVGSGVGWITKLPDATFSKTGETRTWEIIFVGELHIGGGTER